MNDKLRILPIVITIISIIVSIFIYIKTNKEKDIVQKQAAKELSALAMKLFSTEAKIATYELLINNKDIELTESYERIISLEVKQDSLYTQIAIRNRTITNLYNKLNEIPTIIDITDDAQLEFFIKWTSKFPDRLIRAD